MIPLDDNTTNDPRRRAPLVTGETGRRLDRVTGEICRIAEAPTAPRAWYIAFAIAVMMLAIR